MKKMFVVVLSMVVLVLAACGSKTEVTYEIDEQGLKGLMELSAKGDEITNAVQTMEIPYNLFMLSSKEEAEEALKPEIEGELKELEELDGVDFELDFGDDELTQVIKYDFKKLDFDEAEKLDIEFEEDDDYISLEETIENLEDEGWTEKE